MALHVDNGHRGRDKDSSPVARLRDSLWFDLTYKISGIVIGWAVVISLFFGGRLMTTFDETVKIVAETTKQVAVIQQVTIDQGNRLVRIERKLDKQ